MTTNFEDFIWKELEGMFVLVSVPSLSTKDDQYIRRIIKCNSKYFIVNGFPDTRFSYKDGYQTNIQSQWDRRCSCKLLTESEAKELVETWKLRKLIKENLKLISETIDDKSLEELRILMGNLKLRK